VTKRNETVGKDLNTNSSEAFR